MKIYYYTNTLHSDFKVSPQLRPYIKVSDLLTLVAPREMSLSPVYDKYIINNDSLAASRFKTKIEIEVTEDDASYRYRALMQKPQLILKFSLPEYIKIPVGAWCEYMGKTYTLHEDMNFKKNGKRKYEYTLTMGDREDGMGDYKLRNIVYNEANKALADRRLKFSLCAKPEEFLQLIVANLNERDGAGVWKVGSYISASEKTIEFNHTYIDAALSSVASTFETEYEISEDYTISLHRVEYMKDNPLSLSYGKGNGFVPGVGRTTVSEDKPIKRLYVQGGEKNIDRSTYGATELLLPKSQTLRYDGTHFEDEEGFVSANARTYKSDALGYYIERTDKISQAVKEDSLDCSETYPSRIGKVSQWIAVNPESNFYDFIDLTLPTDKTAANYLNFNDAQIAGETMTVIFQDGMLAGKEFEFKYKPDERRFEIKPQEIDGITMPNETYKAVEGNTYAVFGISLPAAYINAYDPAKPTTTKKEGAEWDMFREAIKFLYEHEEQKFTFTGELQSLWAKRHWLQIGAYLKVGAYILFTDNEFCPDGEPIRIVGIKDYLTNPHAPTLELSNGVASASSFSSTLREIENNEVVIDDTKKNIIQFTKRRFRDALETAQMLADANLDNFTSGISPITVQTMSALIGDESLQFRFVSKQSENDAGEITWAQRTGIVGYSNETHTLYANTVSAGLQIYLQHMTLGVKKISSHYDTSELKTWKMTSFESPNLAGEADMAKGYFFYARCSKTNFNDGTFVLSEKAIEMEHEAGYYHFLVGILTSMQEGERSYTDLYGFTEILPGRVTTDIIISSDGQTWFDLVNGEIHGNIRFSNDMDIDDVINAYNATIIEGGKIKTDLIEVANLIARRLEVINENGAGVKIVPNEDNVGSVSIYDENGNEVSVFEGAKYSSISQLYNDTTGDVDVNSHHKGNASVTASSLNNQSESSNNSYVLSDVWHTDTPCEVIMLSGNIRCTASATGYYKSSSSGSSSRPGGITIISPDKPEVLSSAHAMVGISVKTYSDAACKKQIHSSGYIAVCSTSASAGMIADDGMGTGNNYVQGDSRTATLNCIGKSVKVPAGYHKLELYYSIGASRSGSSASVTWGSSVTNGMDLTAEYKCNFYVSRFFANGFCLGLRNDNYVMAWNDGENMNFAVETNGYGFKVLPTGITYRPTANGDWKSLT